MFLPRLGVGLVLSVACVSLSGCASFEWPHELKPHRLWRLNRQPASTQNFYNSIPPEPLANAQLGDAVAEQP